MPIIDSMNMAYYVEKAYNSWELRWEQSSQPYGSYYRFTKKDIEAIYKGLTLLSMKQGIDFYFNPIVNYAFDITRGLEHYKKNIAHDADYEHLYDDITDLTQLPTLVIKVKEDRWLVLNEYGKDYLLQSPQCTISEIEFNYQEYSSILGGIK